MDDKATIHIDITQVADQHLKKRNDVSMTWYFFCQCALDLVVEKVFYSIPLKLQLYSKKEFTFASPALVKSVFRTIILRWS